MGETNNVVYTLTIQDQMSQALRIIEQGLDTLSKKTDQAGNSQRALEAALAQGQTLFNQFGASVNASVQVIDKFGRETADKFQAISSQLQAISSQLQATSTQLQALQKHSVDAGTALQTTGSILQSAFAVAGGIGIATSIGQLVGQLKEFVTTSVGLAVARESLVASFRGITGSAGAARETLEFIRNTATRTGSDFVTLAQSFRNLEAASRGTHVEGIATREVFVGLTEAGRVLGLSQAELGRALLAVEQIISKGKVSQEELRRQLGNALPGATQIAARAFGVTSEELEKLVKAGIPAEEFVRRFGTQLRREFGPGVAEAARTAAAEFARLGNELKELSTEFGNGIVAGLKPVAAFFAQLFEDARKVREERAKEATTGLLAPPEPTGLPPAIGGGAEQIRRQLVREQETLRALEEQNARKLFDLGTLPIVGDRFSIEASLTSQRELVDKLTKSYRQLIRVQRGARGGTIEETEAALGAAEGGEQTADPLAKERAALEEIKRGLEIELSGTQQIARNTAIFQQGAGGEVEKQNVILGAQRKALEGIAELIAKTPGLLKQLTPEFQATFEELNKQYQTNFQLRENAQAVVDKEKADEQERTRTAKALVRDQEKAIETLRRLVAAYTQTKEARDADTASALMAQFPQNATIKALGEEVQEYANARDAIKKYQDIHDTLLTTYTNNQKAITDAAKARQAFNEEIQKAIDLANAEPEERTETRLRARARREGITPTPEQERQLIGLTQLELAKRRAKDIEEIFQGLGRSIESTFSQLFEQIFSGGVTSARSFGLLVAQSLQQLFARLASQLVLTLINQFAESASGAKAGSGIGGAVAIGGKILTSIIAAYLGGGGGGAGAGIAGGGSGASGAGPSVFTSGADGMVVTRPTFALVGDDRAGFGEAVIPLSRNRAVPVEMHGGSRGSEQPIVLQVTLAQDFSGSIDPRSLRTKPPEIIQAVVKDITGDGVTRRVIMQHAR